MPSRTPPPAGELGELPGFKTPATAGESPHPDESNPTPPAPSTTSPPHPLTSSSPSSPTELPGDSSRSTTGSTEPDEPPRPPVSISAELSEELENFAGGLFELGGLAVNRLVRRREHSNTRLWLVTEEEATDFGAAAGRIAARRIPDELKEGDGADALIMGSVLLGYSMRNVAGVTGPEVAAAQAAAAAPSPGLEPEPAAAPAPPPPPPSPAEQRQPASSRVGGAVVVGVEEATPAPPSAISPDL